MDKAVVSERITYARGLPDEIKRLANKEVYVYPETVSRSENPKTVGVITTDKIINSAKSQDQCMVCMGVEFLKMNQACKAHLGLT